MSCPRRRSFVACLALALFAHVAAAQDHAAIARAAVASQLLRTPLAELTVAERVGVLSATLAVAPEAFGDLMASARGREAVLQGAFARCSEALGAAGAAAAEPDAKKRSRALGAAAARGGFEQSMVAELLARERGIAERIVLLAQESALAIVTAAGRGEGDAKRLLGARIEEAVLLREATRRAVAARGDAREDLVREVYAATYRERLREALVVTLVICPE